MAAGEGTNTLTMREKALLKSQLKKQHVTIHAGYAPISEIYLHKTGLRGRKGMLFYSLVVLLFAIALINLAVIVVLLSVLRIGYGMESMEFITGGRLLRFLNHADMGTVIPDSGVIGGFTESDLPITGDNQPIIFRTTSGLNFGKYGPSMEIHHDHTVISGVEEFLLQSPSSGKNIFSTEYKDFKLPTGVSHLSVKEAHISRWKLEIYLAGYQELEKELTKPLSGHELIVSVVESWVQVLIPLEACCVEGLLLVKFL
ncbi:beta-sarcoglycan [Trichonephila clavipes]|nr:beta-sarcoglycan [Trichonephila clavipes]